MNVNRRIRCLPLVAAVATLATPQHTLFAQARPLGQLDPELSKKVDAAIANAMGFLKAAQMPDGGWPAFDKSDPAITALVTKAFAQDKNYGPANPVTQRGFKRVLEAAQDDGGIYLPEQGLRNYYTSVGVMALALSDEPDAKAAVAKAKGFLVGLQWDEGEGYSPSQVFYGGAGYGHDKRPDLSNTQMMLEALHDSGLSPENPVYKKAMVFISRCQMLPETNDQPFAAYGDGGFIYSPANGGESKAGTETVDGHERLRSYGSMTYAGLKSMIYARVDHQDPRVRHAMEWIQKHYTLDQNPNMPAAQAEQGLYYFYHTFAKALAAYGEPVIVDAEGRRHNWREELCTKLLSLQRKDGSWVNEADRWWESNPYLVTAYSVLALQEAQK